MRSQKGEVFVVGASLEKKMEAFAKVGTNLIWGKKAWALKASKI